MTEQNLGARMIARIADLFCMRSRDLLALDWETQRSKEERYSKMGLMVELKN